MTTNIFFHKAIEMKILTKKNLIRLIIFGFVMWLLGSYVGSRIATRTHPQAIPPASNYFTQVVENQSFKSYDEIEISSWFIPKADSKKAVIILNGIGGNRLNLVPRAKFYQQNNYNVLLPDLRGTGESGGDVITFGWKERFDFLAGVNFLKEKGIDTIAVHGLSLGAATIVYSFQENTDYDFVVLESCYDNITNALNHRVDRIPLPSFIYFPLTKFTEMRVGATQEELSPEKYIHLCEAPTFILAGDSERKVLPEETQKLFDKCGAKTKQLHFFKGAYHEDFMRRFGEEWKVEMQNWLDKF